MTDFYKEYIKTGAVGLEVGLSIMVGGGLGYFVEQRYAISPWGVIIGAGLGVVAATRTLIRFSRKYLKDNP